MMDRLPFSEDFLEYVDTAVGLQREALARTFSSQSSLSEGDARRGASLLVEHDGLRKPLEAAVPVTALKVAWLLKKSGHHVELPSCPRCARQTPLRSRAREGTFSGQLICGPCYSRLTKTGPCPLCEKVAVLDFKIEGSPSCGGCYARHRKNYKTCSKCKKDSLHGTRRTGEWVCIRCADFKREICSWCNANAKVTKRIGESACCGLCYKRVTRDQVPCPKCGRAAIIAYPLAGYRATCATCSGVKPTYICRTCGSEEFRTGSLCSRCWIRSTGKVLIEEANADSEYWWPLFELLASSENPNGTKRWMTKKTLPRDLKVLLSEAPPSPAVFDRLPPKRAAYLKHLTSHYLGLSHEPNRVLDVEFESLSKQLSGKHKSDFSIFYKWHAQRVFGKSRAFLVSSAQRNSVTTMRAAYDFLSFLQLHEIDPEQATPAHWNIYLQKFPMKRRPIFPYYSWKRRQHAELRNTVDIAVSTKQQLDLIPPDTHRSIIRELLEREEISPDVRAAGLLLGLYGQSVSKVVTLRTDALHSSEDGEYFLRLGKTPVIVPHAIGELLLASRAKGGYSGNGAVDRGWLMPGKSPGSHLSPQTIRYQLQRSIGVTANQLRQSGLHHLVRSAPPSIIADTMGYQVRSLSLISGRYSQQWSQYPSLRFNEHRNHKD